MTRRRWIADEVSGNRAALTELTLNTSLACSGCALAKRLI